jgi:hypothetical protein
MMQKMAAKEKGKFSLARTFREYYIFCDYMQICIRRKAKLSVSPG